MQDHRLEKRTPPHPPRMEPNPALREALLAEDSINWNEALEWDQIGTGSWQDGRVPKVWGIQEQTQWHNWTSKMEQ